MNSFKSRLHKKVLASIKNDFGKENFDENRFGLYEETHKTKVSQSNSQYTPSVKKRLKKVIKEMIGYHPENDIQLKKIDAFISPFEIKLNKIWEVLSQKDRSLFIDLLVFKHLGFKKVKLPLNTTSYWENLEIVNALADTNDIIDPSYLHFILKRFNLKSLGYNIDIYYTEAGVLTDFVVEQYAYKINDKTIVEVEAGDVVLDCGGCWGDTALYFSHKCGNTGKVYSFEFIPGNIKIFHKNISLNPHLKSVIELVQNPVSNSSDEVIYFKDNGPGSVVKFEPFTNQTGTVNSISIDDFVEKNSIEKVDFIKMDIEGAEPIALEGAIKTIKKFKPKLAIAIYHSMDDFTNIPNWIIDLNLDYEIFIGHYKIFGEETVCFAKQKDK